MFFYMERSRKRNENVQHCEVHPRDTGLGMIGNQRTLHNIENIVSRRRASVKEAGVTRQDNDL